MIVIAFSIALGILWFNETVGHGWVLHWGGAIATAIWTHSKKPGDLFCCALLWSMVIGAVVAMKLGFKPYPVLAEGKHNA
jgi:hypothetical protein